MLLCAYCCINQSCQKLASLSKGWYWIGQRWMGCLSSCLYSLRFIFQCISWCKVVNKGKFSSFDVIWHLWGFDIQNIFADCQGIGVYREEGKLATSPWIYCSCGCKIQPESQKSYSTVWDLPCPTVKYWNIFGGMLLCVLVIDPFPCYFFIIFPAPIHFICYGCRYPFTNSQVIPPMDWEEYVLEIASDIMKEQSPKRFFILNTSKSALVVQITCTYCLGSFIADYFARIVWSTGVRLYYIVVSYLGGLEIDAKCK